MSLQLAEKKRKLCADMASSSQFIASGQTLLRVMVVRIMPGSKSALHRSLICMSLMSKPIEVSFTSKKQKNGTTVEPHNPDETGGLLNATIEPNEEFYVNCFDRQVSHSLQESDIVLLSVTASFYNGKVFYKSASVAYDGPSDPLCPEGYAQYIVHNELGVVPTKENVRPEQFKPGTETKNMIRRFVLPLSQHSSLFEDVCIYTLDHEAGPERMTIQGKDTPPKVGFNIQVGAGEQVNQIGVFYISKDASKASVSMSLNVLPPDSENGRSVYEVFGITDLDMWASVGVRMANNAKDWFVYGYSNLDRILRIRGNQLEDESNCSSQSDSVQEANEEEDDQIVVSTGKRTMFSTGLILRMRLDLGATVENAGMLLTRAFVDAFFDDFSYEARLSSPHINDNYRTSIDRHLTGTVFNLSEMDEGIRNSFLSLVDKRNCNIKFYGVFNSSDVEVDQLSEHDLHEHGKQPAVVFGVIGEKV